MTNKVNFTLNEAQKKLVEEYYFLAKNVVNRCFISKHGMIACKYYKEDAYQDASIALCKAAYTYNENDSRGASFSTYATVVIKNHIKNMIERHLKYTNEVSDEILDDDNNIAYSCQFLSDSDNRLDCQEILKVIEKRKAVVEKRCPFAYDIFVHRTLYNKPMQDIAKMFNVPRRTAYFKFDFAQKDLLNQVSLQTA